MILRKGSEGGFAEFRWRAWRKGEAAGDLLFAIPIRVVTICGVLITMNPIDGSATTPLQRLPRSTA